MELNSKYMKKQEKRQPTEWESAKLILLVVLAIAVPLLIIVFTHPAGALLPVSNTSSATLYGNPVPAMPPSVTQWWVVAWVILMVLILWFIYLLGQYNLSRPMGIFINEQNIMSLSRMQIVAWTLVIVSALFVMVCVRLIYGEPDPFGIIIDWHVWAVLGLSASAAVGGPLINSGKSQKDPVPTDQQTVNLANMAAAVATGPDADKKKTEAANLAAYPQSVNDAAKSFGQTPEEVEKSRDGILYGNTDPSEARFTDIFEGDELDNTMYIDISKVQMFWFSVIAIGGYAILVLGMLYGNSPVNLNALPYFSDGLVAILAVSHATYLGGKGFTKTKSTS